MPRAGVEPASLSAVDFESTASANSATRAMWNNGDGIRESGGKPGIAGPTQRRRRMGFHVWLHRCKTILIPARPMPDFRVYCRPGHRRSRRDRPLPRRIPPPGRGQPGAGRATPSPPSTAGEPSGSAPSAEADKRPRASSVRFTQKAKPLPYAITLGQALPKGGFMDAIVRKATELGVARIVPLESERTQVHLDGGPHGTEDRRNGRSPLWRRPSSAAIPGSRRSLPCQGAAAFMQSAAGLRPEADRQPPARRPSR